jgi:UDP-N-acetyl-D-mannosaminuronic acid dehydrogenase
MNARQPADRVVIAGLGKIGLPLALQFASSGATVIGYDTDPERCARINQGQNPLPDEPGLDELLPAAVADGRLRADTDPRAATGAGVLVFVVPVDIDERHQPDFSSLDHALAALAPHIRNGALVLVETTVPVGTTRNRVGTQLAKACGLEAGEGFMLAFSPERVSSGTVLRDLARYPKIVGGIDASSAARAASFYGRMLDAEIITLRDAETAEYSKLIETTYRDVNIALANEFAKIGDAFGVDTLGAIGAANTQPYSHVHAPGPGVGGHCIPVYPYFVGAPQIESTSVPNTDLISIARRINDGMADYAADRLAAALGGLAGKTIVIIGLAYRSGVKESRHSSAVLLAQALKEPGATVYVQDPLFTDDEIRAHGLVPPPGWPQACDALVVQAYHPAHEPLPYEEFGGLRAVLDTRSLLDRAVVEAAGVEYLTIG